MLEPIEVMIENMQEVRRLMEIHEELTGTSPGRRHRVAVLNKSALVLITACWESVIEDIARESIDFLVEKADSPEVLPAKVRTLASRELKKADDDTKIWDLAGNGWKTVMRIHRDRTMQRFLGTFNTPKAKNVDQLFKDLVGISRVSSSWHWGKLSADKARRKLDDFVSRRGEVAHRVATSKAITKPRVRAYQELTFRLAVKTSNEVNRHINDLVGESPWIYWKFRSVF